MSFWGGAIATTPESNRHPEFISGSADHEIPKRVRNDNGGFWTSQNDKRYMDDQIILGVDEQGNFTGEYFPKMVGHTGEGRHHLAITVLLYNNKGEVLLQKRKHQVFDNIWDFTGATHPLHKEDDKDETFEEATLRCLKVEYGIDHVGLKNLGGFNYFAKIDALCENEHCMMMVGEYNGEVNLNPEVGYEYKWMDKSKFLKDIEQNPKNYSPWAVEGVKILKQAKFF